MTAYKITPYDAIDVQDIERRARLMRAEATRDGVRALRVWIAARFAALTPRRTVHGA
ncbi:RSP_7527 family protein [Oceaniovalibus sp. ACAM 378]|uniref:RSP_7527 family protein n=1 Tax=Oceaniovalibus sp. ACAM 378 TaxID=2599923 RepID=UPI001652212B|nr:hypothetical protein [Oceaniovalibus sp. ACAM 378]